MITITKDLHDAIRKSGHTYKTIAPLIGLTGATFSYRKTGKVSWELDKILLLMDILHIPRTEIFTYFRIDIERRIG